ncbi:MAG: nucleotidyltransferase domain-containing protein [Nanoarchaeota archaeon]|nr:nucleotidyltransferase domain-containing protein [Nanoarchaeota archaeon]
MLTKTQLKILNSFRKDIFAKLDFKQVKSLSRQKSNNVIQSALAAFKGMNLVMPEKAGKSIFYSLNFQNMLTLSYLSILSDIELRSNNMLPFGVLRTIQNGIQEYTPFFVLFVFGSYAKKTPRRDSDLDIAVIVETDATRKEIIPALETVKRRELLEIDYHVFTIGEFLEMLFDKDENLGKQICRGSIIYYGAEQYYALLSENTKRIIL